MKVKLIVVRFLEAISYFVLQRSLGKMKLCRATRIQRWFVSVFTFTLVSAKNIIGFQRVFLRLKKKKKLRIVATFSALLKSSRIIYTII